MRSRGTNDNYQPANKRKASAVILILTSIIMAAFGLGFLGSYLASTTYYNVGVFYPALIIGLWNLSTFPIVLGIGIYLIKRRHNLATTLGLILVIISGLIQILSLSIYPYDWINGLPTGLLFISLSIITLVTYQFRY